MKLRTLFFCGQLSRYGLSHLRPVLASSFDIVAVVLASEARWKLFRESLSGKVLAESRPSYAKMARKIYSRAKQILSIRRAEGEVETLCSERNIPVLKVFDVNEISFLNEIERLNIDLILSAAYPQIFYKNLLNIPNCGSVNFHPSLLPKFRGAHPHFWAIAKGETESGISAHFMTERIDDGDIVAQIAFPVSGLSYDELYDKIVLETPSLMKLVEKFLYTDGAIATPQDSSQATYFRNDRVIHHRIFWSLSSAEEIGNLVRTRKAYCFFRENLVNIVDAYTTEFNRNLTNDVSVTPGVIVDFLEDAIVVKARNGCVNVRVLRTGRRPFKFDKWIRKNRVQIGEKFD